jgi:NAD+ synthase (glutamine-hydrolysing)
VCVCPSACRSACLRARVLGGVSKVDLRKFIAWAQHELNLPLLQEYVRVYALGDLASPSLERSRFLDATPTAELEPTDAGHVQKDEEDMGMTYEELSVYGRLRKLDRLGPLGMFNRLQYTCVAA